MDLELVPSHVPEARVGRLDPYIFRIWQSSPSNSTEHYAANFNTTDEIKEICRDLKREFDNYNGNMEVTSTEPRGIDPFLLSVLTFGGYQADRAKAWYAQSERKLANAKPILEGDEYHFQAPPDATPEGKRVKCYEIRTSENPPKGDAGRGMFAVTDIGTAVRILEDTPAIYVVQKNSRFDEELYREDPDGAATKWHDYTNRFTRDDVENAVRTLSKEYKDLWRTMNSKRTNMSPDMTVNKLWANGFMVTDPTEPEDVIVWCPEVSLINHHCFPNAWAEWDPAAQTVVVRALVDIKEGDEITIAYGSGLHSKKRIALRFGFDCRCGQCRSYEVPGESNTFATIKTETIMYVAEQRAKREKQAAVKAAKKAALKKAYRQRKKAKAQANAAIPGDDTEHRTTPVSDNDTVQQLGVGDLAYFNKPLINWADEVEDELEEELQNAAAPSPTADEEHEEFHDEELRAEELRNAEQVRLEEFRVAEELCAEEVRPEEVLDQEIHPEEVRPEEVCPDEILDQEIHADDLRAEERDRIEQIRAEMEERDRIEQVRADMEEHDRIEQARTQKRDRLEQARDRIEQIRAKQVHSEKIRIKEQRRQDEQLRIEQTRAKQVRAEEIRLEQQRRQDEQLRMEQVRAEQVRAEKICLEEQGRQDEQIRMEQVRAQQVRSEEIRLEEQRRQDEQLRQEEELRMASAVNDPVPHAVPFQHPDGTTYYQVPTPAQQTPPFVWPYQTQVVMPPQYRYYVPDQYQYQYPAADQYQYPAPVQDVEPHWVTEQDFAQYPHFSQHPEINNHPVEVIREYQQRWSGRTDIPWYSFCCEDDNHDEKCEHW